MKTLIKIIVNFIAWLYKNAEPLPEVVTAPKPVAPKIKREISTAEKIMQIIVKVIGRILLEIVDLALLIVIVAFGLSVAIVGSLLGLIICGGLITCIIGFAIIAGSIGFGVKLCTLEAIGVYMQAKCHGDMLYRNLSKLEA